MNPNLPGLASHLDLGRRNVYEVFPALRSQLQDGRNKNRFASAYEPAHADLHHRAPRQEGKLYRRSTVTL
jgi:hypothetical protein